ncbi:MAG: S41 family peptidase [Gammaproteobacteria bacterium]|nr:S41 family peptidase [Gammaproteobacteria bacterium]
MRPLVRIFPLLLAGLVAGAMVSVGQDVLAKKENAAPLPLAELQAFSQVLEKIKSDYVEEVDDKTLINNAIKGMLSGLDPHSTYLDPDDYKDLQAGTSGEFGGLGIEVTMEDGFIKVVAPIDDTPAQRAGVKAGDTIIRLDDTSVKGLSLGDAVKVMRGKPGSVITLTIIREGADKPLKLDIERDVIKVQSVKSRTLEDGYGYVRITQFQSHTNDHLRDAVDELKRDNGGELRGLVLDLRNNPGGVLSAAVSVSDAFIKKGLLVYTEGRIGDSRLKFNAKPTDILNGAPLVVLVNGGSASASEIVAGALQDQERAVIMGEATFGKGSVQTILPMENGSALKLTTARYYTPSGRSIQAEGIVPDIVLENVTVAAAEDTGSARLKERDLTRHLTNGEDEDTPRDDAPSTKGQNEEEEDIAPLASRDYPLYEALNLLKGLAIIRGRS